MQKITKISLVVLVLVGVAVAFATGVFTGSRTSGNGLDELLTFIPADSPVVVVGQTKADYTELSNKTLQNMNPNDIQPLIDLLDASEEGSGAQLVRWLIDDYIQTAATQGQQGLVDRYGANPTGPYGFYFSGAAPVVRFSLTSAEPLMAVLAEAEQETGVTAEQSTLGSATLYAWSLNEEKPEIKLGLALDERSLTLSLLNSKDTPEARMLRFARQPQAEPLAGTERLKQLRKDYADADQFMGYVDFQQIVTALFSPEQNGTGRELRTWFPEFEQDFAQDMSDACRNDYVALASHMPRITMGSDGYSVNGNELGQDLSFLWHINNDSVVTSLQKLQGHVPGYARTVDDKLAAYALGLNVSQLVPVLSEFWTQFTQAEFQCEQLQAMQQQAQSYNPAMLAMGTAMVDSVRGAGIALFNLEPSDTTPVGLDGSVLVSISSENPAALASMASSFVPGMMGLSIPSDGTAVEIPDPMGLGGNFAAIKGKHLVVYRGSAGEAAANNLAGETLETNGLSALALNLREPMKMFNTVEPVMQTMGNPGCAETFVGLLNLTQTPISMGYQEALGQRGWRGDLSIEMEVADPVTPGDIAGEYELALLDDSSCSWEPLGQETLGEDQTGGFASESADGACDEYQSEFTWSMTGRLLSQSTHVERQRDACDSDWNTMETAENFECGVIAAEGDHFYCSTMTDGVTELYRYSRL
ncbi:MULTISPECIES: hypothetical protein [unclassified Marinimicrobium]|jgi:hypothetical protein|uniref:hypothetical protein n=1 Tax=unclassified Marinimicrobium TaxID=2632100 RepID=UPI000C64D8B3|nr:MULTISPECIES: hypothetical protein [unclassified Marinimicrobium]MAN53285.1 hypothetical protein [Marinimicrobium sp.]